MSHARWDPEWLRCVVSRAEKAEKLDFPDPQRVSTLLRNEATAICADANDNPVLPIGPILAC